MDDLVFEVLVGFQMSYHDLEFLGVSGIIDVLALFSRIVEVFCKG